MADVSVTVRPVTRNAFTAAQAATTALTAGDVAVVPSGSGDKLLVLVTNTTASKKVTVATAPASRAGAAGQDLVLTFDAAETRAIVLESAKYAQADGNYRITMEGAGSIMAYRLT